jgi:hypothetical protein
MALRVLIVAMLVVGFSRPVIEEKRIPGFTSASKTSVVFILDDSFSMEVVDGRGSYFNQAKGAISTILSGLKEGDEATIILTSGDEKELEKRTGNFPQLKKTIKGLEVSYLGGSLNSAVIKAASILGESENLNKELYILSDFQKSTLGDPKEFTDVSLLLDSRVKTYLFHFNTKKIVNASVTGIKVNNRIFEPGKEISVTATVKNFSIDPMKNSVISLFINGERGAQKSFNLEPGKITDITLFAPVPKTGYSEISVQIEDDDIKSDNIRYGSVFLPQEFRTVLLGKNNDLKFIKAAIEAGSFAGNMKIIEKDIAQIGSIDLNEVNMLILSGSGEGADFGKLKEFVRNGGGVMLLPGENTSLNGFNSLLNPFGVTSAVELKKDAKAFPGKFASVQFIHPLLKEIFQTPYGNNVESPELITYFKLPSGGGDDIISLSEGTSFLKETRLGKGKVLTIAAPAIVSAGNLPLIPLFAPLIYRSLFYLASEEPTGTETLLGEEIRLNEKRTGGGKIDVKAPGAKEFVLQASDKKAEIVFNQIEKPGVYKFSREGKDIDFIPVNLDTIESNSKLLDNEEISDYFTKIKVKNKPNFVEPSGDFKGKIVEARLGSELWKFFIILALILIAFEMYLSKAKKKDIVI